MKKQIFVGTSGYNYPHWREVFYPANLNPREWLEFYVQYFNSVELNVTFYRLPQKKTFQTWYRKTPHNFRFVLKGSRFITHIKRLSDCQHPLKVFFDSASLLKEKLICVLWQFPPSLKFDCGRLEKFANILRENYSWCLHSFEFRNKTWFNDLTYKILKENNFNLCFPDSPNYPLKEIITSNFLYLRFHGGKVLYGSEYSLPELKKWVKKVKGYLSKKIEKIFVFFNNDAYGFAIKNALQFKELLKDEKI
ncbi:MAG: DUF72 domain-containing protein [Candidatus Omnitrophica bacterium]|nr:DUF72 domain-containing protein [Candidatus Omnitrophota bacterium]